MDYPSGNLGITHTDEGLILCLQRLGFFTLLDIGCSVGGQVELANRLGMSAWGIDGDFELMKRSRCPSRVLYVDLTVAPIEMPMRFDSIWCVEVAEHIPECHIGNLMNTIRYNLNPCGVVIFTANDGPGIHHVTCHSMSWWIGLARDYGLVPCDRLTEMFKKQSTMERGFVRDNGIVFKLNGICDTEYHGI